MSGPGTTTVAWTREDGFLSLPTSPTYVHPGRNVQVQEVELRNALEESRLPDDNEAIEAIAQELEGALALEYDLTHPWALTDVFVSDYTDPDADGVLEWAMGNGQMPTSRWFIGVDVGSAIAERVPMGAATTQLQVSITQGSNVRVSQTIVYADEKRNTSITPGTIVGKDESPYVYHGSDLVFDGTNLKKLQSGTLDIQNRGALDRGWNRKAVDATAGEPIYRLNVSKTITDTVSDNVALAYGDSTGASTTPTTDGQMDAVDASIPVTRGDGDTITFNLTGVRPNSLGWDNIPPTGEERAQEAIELFVDSVDATADVTMADPFA